MKLPNFLKFDWSILSFRKLSYTLVDHRCISSSGEKENGLKLTYMAWPVKEGQTGLSEGELVGGLI
jgi:hypothetical protein